MNRRVDALAWPEGRIGEAMLALARAGGLAPSSVDVPAVAAPLEPDPAWTEQAVTRFADWLGVEAAPVGAQRTDVDALLRRGAPLLARLPHGRVLAIARARGHRLEVVAPDHRVHRVDAREVRGALTEHLEKPHAAEVEAVLAAAQVSARRRDRTRDAILAARLSGARVEGCWMLRAPAGSSFRRELVRQHVPARAAGLLVAHAAQIALAVGSWWALGEGAFGGTADAGWLAAWVLLLLTQVPVRAAAVRAQGGLAVDLGVLLERWLLAGALRVDRDRARTEGAGQLLGRVLECDAVSRLAFGAGLAGVLAVVELVLAGVVLAFGAAALGQLALLAAWAAVALALGLRVHHRTAAWTDERLALTHDTIERLVGHRTRRTQGRGEDLHVEEDRALGLVVDRGRAMDRVAWALAAVVPRGWLVTSLAVLAPAFVSPGRSTAALGIALGGAVVAYRALRRFTDGVQGIAGALVAWRRVRPLFEAASRFEPAASPRIGVDAPASLPRQEHGAVLEGRDLFYGHHGRGEPVLRAATIHVDVGDRVLVEGPSGSGKSTLAAILAGLREPQSGRLALGGIDRRSLGSWVWRGRVAAAPQFHENHVLGASLAFNLLMGRRWPPTQADLQEAEGVCRELGLDDLLARMPGGLAQMVGETGWQLSHGERSRVFIARALLQGADLVVLDESFAALDPGTLRRAAACVHARARSLLVVAHP